VLSPRCLLLVLALALSLMLPGCQPEEKITRTVRPRLNDMKRLLAAIAQPDQRNPEGKNWFFKVTGLETEIEPLVDPFHQFVRTIRFAGPAADPTWALPAGWVEDKEKDKKGRFATIMTAPKGLELTVTFLQGKGATSIPLNVDRWRGQLGLRSVGTDRRRDFVTYEDFCTYEQAGDLTIVVVDMVGPGGPVGGAPTDMPALQPPQPKGPPFQYETPPGWKQLPPGNMQVLLFRASSDKESADISVSVFPGDTGGLLANVNRWRGMLGLKPQMEGEVKALPQVAVGNAKGTLVDIANSEAPPDKNRMLGAILMRERDSLFFKMTGPKDFLELQKPAFEAFLKSVLIK
jgi:hypothetical protein